MMTCRDRIRGWRLSRLWVLPIVLVGTTWCDVARADEIMVDLTATAQDLGGQEADQFQLIFDSNHPDVRIASVLYDLSGTDGELFFDVSGTDNAAFAPLVGNEPTIDYADTYDESDWLYVEFSDFRLGQTLRFGIDVDGSDCSVFTAQQFAGTRVIVQFDVSLIDPLAETPQVELKFEDNGTGSVTAGGLVPVPEPTTLGSTCAAATLIGLLRRRRERKREHSEWKPTKHEKQETWRTT